MPGIILYGPPAAGKDTITRELVEASKSYALFRRLKIGGGRTEGYRLTTESAANNLRQIGDVLWENRRYGSTYLVDRSAISKELDRSIPILHLGQPEGVRAVLDAYSAGTWIVVHLWCAPDIAARRIEARGTGDTAERLAVWYATPSIRADVEINTGEVSAQEAARRINATVMGRVDSSRKSAR
jgi:guanylate kinase